MRKQDVLIALDTIYLCECGRETQELLDRIQDKTLHRLTTALCKWATARQQDLGPEVAWRAAYIVLAARIGYARVAWAEAMAIPHEGLRRSLLHIALRHDPTMRSTAVAA